ncbi:MAG: hypothetical protein QOE51_55 [Actinoplanes sp.]|nr:hypothetical protein [Actinoplanes sp.]
MIEPSGLLAVAFISLGMAVTPGPNVVYLISRTLADGRRAGLICLCGIGLGYCVHLIAAVLGLAAAFLAVPEFYSIFKFAGAAYLVWLAWKAIRPGGSLSFATTVPELYNGRHRTEPDGNAVQCKIPPVSTAKLFTMGLITNLLNPKPLIMYASLIPQFMNVRAGNLVGQAAILGTTHIVVSLLTHVGLVLTAGPVAVFLSQKPSWLRAHRYATGVVLAAFAVELAVGTTMNGVH